MNLINKFISYIKKVCKNDEICVMVVFVLLGFMLCYLFKDEISGFTLQGAPIDFGSDSPTNNVLANNGSLSSILTPPIKSASFSLLAINEANAATLIFSSSTSDCISILW